MTDGPYQPELLPAKYEGGVVERLQLRCRCCVRTVGVACDAVLERNAGIICSDCWEHCRILAPVECEFKEE